MAEHGVEHDPSPEYLRELYDHIQAFWRPERTKDEKRLQVQADEHKLQVIDTNDPRRMRRVETKRMTTAEGRRISRLVSSFYVAPAQIGVQWSGEGSPKVTDDIEIALNEAIDQLNPAHDSPRRRENQQALILGRRARLIAPGHTYWWDFPFKRDDESEDQWDVRFKEWHRKAPLPIVWLDLPAESTFPATFGRIDEELLCSMELTYAEISDIFSEDELGPVRGDKAKLSDMTTLVIYSNLNYLTYALMKAPTGGAGPITFHSDFILRSIAHGMGRPAIRVLPFLVGGTKVPGKYWEGILDPVLDLIIATDSRLSDAATAATFDANPIMKAWLDDGDKGEGATSRRETFMEGDIFRLKLPQSGEQKEDIEPMFQPQFSGHTQALFQWGLARIAQITGTPEVLEGAMGPTGMPAWSRNSAIEQAQFKHGEGTDSMVAADIDAAESIMRAVTAFGEPLRLQRRDGEGKGSINLDPEGLDNWIPVLKADYKVKLPISERADWDLMLSSQERAKAAGIPISWETIASRLGGIEQPWDEFRRWIAWDTVLSPEFLQTLRLAELEELEIDLGEDEGMSADQLMAIPSEEMPAGTREALLQRAGGGVNPQTQGAIRAGFPLQSRPGGPPPESERPQ